MTSGKAFDPQAACVFGESAVQPMRSIRLRDGRQYDTIDDFFKEIEA